MDEIEPANDETIISRRNNLPDDATVVSRRSPKPTDDPPADETIISSRRTPQGSGESFDETIITPKRLRADEVSDETVIVSRNQNRGDDESDETVIVTSAKFDETIVTRRKDNDTDDTVISGRAAKASPAPVPTIDDIAMAGGRTATSPEASVGSPVEFARTNEPVVEKVERLDFGVPPPRTKQPTDPAAVYERAMTKSRRNARNLALLLIASAVFLGVAIALAVVFLA
jgi:hypothetical protein